MDLESSESLSSIPDVDVFFHVAGRLSGSQRELLAVNEIGTKHLARTLAARSKPPIVVGLSSIAAAGPSNPSEGRSENLPPMPVSNYGKSKLAGERVLASHFCDLPISIVRPGIVFGPGDREFLKILQAMNRVFLNPMIGWGRAPLSFIEVSDLVRLLVLVAEKGERISQVNAHGDPLDGIGIYNAASPDPLSLLQLGRLFARSLHRPVLPLPLPPFLAFAVGLAGEWFSQLTKSPSTLTRDKIREAIAEGWMVKVDKAISQLGWSCPSINDVMTHWIVRAKREGRL
jgi:nucleoside-diphosphate-sugar epimerase